MLRFDSKQQNSVEQFPSIKNTEKDDQGLSILLSKTTLAIESKEFSWAAIA